MQTSPFALTFAPWTPDGPRRVVASEREWARLRDLDRSAAASGERPIVLVGCDVFEPWEGLYVDEKGDRCAIYQGNGGITKTAPYACAPPVNCTWMTRDLDLAMLLLVARFTPNLRWVFPFNSSTCVREAIHRAADYASNSSIHRKYRDGAMLAEQWLTGHPIPNLSLLLDASTPAEVDAGVPELLRVPAASRVVRITVTKETEGVSLEEWLYTIRVEHDGDGNTQEVPCKPPIDWLILRGEAGPDARPCPLHVMRRLIGEAQAAGVPVWVENVGEPLCEICDNRLVTDEGDEDRIWYCTTCPFFTFDRSDPAEWPAWARVREVPHG